MSQCANTNTGLAVVAAVVAGLCLPCTLACAKDLKSIGISVGSLGNPYFVTLAKGAEAKAKMLNPQVRVTTLSADYDLNRQFNQIDNFIAAGVQMILLNAVDAKAVTPAIKRAQKAGVVVVAVDVAAGGADATVQTDNIQAGSLACQYIATALKGRGEVIIENGPQVAAVVDRVTGCKAVFAKYPGLHLLSADQDGKGSRDGGYSVAQGYLTRYAKLDALFAINDPQAIGTDLAARQLHRSGIIITSVDGAPEIETALKGQSMIQASASQDPWGMAQKAVGMGYELMNGKQPDPSTVLIPSTLVTRENVKSYQGWSSPR